MRTPPPLPPQLPNEPDLSYALFCEYCQLSTGRSIRALSELTKRSRPSLGRLSLRWQWPDRASAWDRSHAVAPDPSQDGIDALGDRKARIAVALDAAISLISDKLAGADPLETPARSITGLVSALGQCLEMARALDPNPLLTEQLQAIEVLLPSIAPRLATKVASRSRELVAFFKAEAEAGFEAQLGLLDGDDGEAIDVPPRI